LIGFGPGVDGGAGDGDLRGRPVDLEGGYPVTASLGFQGGVCDCQGVGPQIVFVVGEDKAAQGAGYGAVGSSPLKKLVKNTWPPAAGRMGLCVLDAATKVLMNWSN
jgi:hypothetical protein